MFKDLLGDLVSKVDNVVVYLFATFVFLVPIRALLFLIGIRIPYEAMMIVGATLTLLVMALTTFGRYKRGDTIRPQDNELWALAFFGLQFVPTHFAVIVGDSWLGQTLLSVGTMFAMAATLLGRTWYREYAQTLRGRGGQVFDLLKNDLKYKKAKMTSTEADESATPDSNQEEKVVVQTAAPVKTEPVEKIETPTSEYVAAETTTAVSELTDAEFFAVQVGRSKQGAINPFVFRFLGEPKQAFEIINLAKVDATRALEQFQQTLDLRGSDEQKAKFAAILQQRTV